MRAGLARGFTLLELLVVVSIMAIATAGVALSLRDSTQDQTERDALRLAALLESARAQSRSRGVAVVWHATAQGFRFEGLPAGSLPEHWLNEQTMVAAGGPLVLGPEPIIAAQSVTLTSRQSPGVQSRVGSDGLRPFAVQAGSLDAAEAAAKP